MRTIQNWKSYPTISPQHKHKHFEPVRKYCGLTLRTLTVPNEVNHKLQANVSKKFPNVHLST
jgi:hypothetical protein